MSEGLLVGYTLGIPTCLPATAPREGMAHSIVSSLVGPQTRHPFAAGRCVESVNPDLHGLCRLAYAVGWDLSPPVGAIFLSCLLTHSLRYGLKSCAPAGL